MVGLWVEEKEEEEGIVLVVDYSLEMKWKSNKLQLSLLQLRDT